MVATAIAVISCGTGGVCIKPDFVALTMTVFVANNSIR
jgi:hypothetical protein